MIFNDDHVPPYRNKPPLSILCLAYWYIYLCIHNIEICKYMCIPNTQYPIPKIHRKISKDPVFANILPPYWPIMVQVGWWTRGNSGRNTSVGWSTRASEECCTGASLTTGRWTGSWCLSTSEFMSLFKVNGFMMSQYQRVHVALQLQEVLQRFQPSVPPDLVSVQFVPIQEPFDQGVGTKS